MTPLGRGANSAWTQNETGLALISTALDSDRAPRGVSCDHLLLKARLPRGLPVGLHSAQESPVLSQVSFPCRAAILNRLTELAPMKAQRANMNQTTGMRPIGVL